MNEYLELTNRQSQQHGLKRISLASLFAAARFNAHVYLSSIKPSHAAGERTDFLDYMTTMYRRMLNEHLDGMGQERDIDVGESELAAEYAAAGVQVGQECKATPANDYVSAAGAVPPGRAVERMTRLQQRLGALHSAGRKALVPFMTAGDPSLAATVPVMHALVEAGADVIELGVPFSDPMADGPVIQRSSERALLRGAGQRYVLDCVRQFRERDARSRRWC